MSPVCLQCSVSMHPQQQWRQGANIAAEAAERESTDLCALLLLMVRDGGVCGGGGRGCPENFLAGGLSLVVAGAIEVVVVLFSKSQYQRQSTSIAVKWMMARQRRRARKKKSK